VTHKINQPSEKKKEMGNMWDTRPLIDKQREKLDILEDKVEKEIDDLSESINERSGWITAHCLLVADKELVLAEVRHYNNLRKQRRRLYDYKNTLTMMKSQVQSEEWVKAMSDMQAQVTRTLRHSDHRLSGKRIQDRNMKYNVQSTKTQVKHDVLHGAMQDAFQEAQDEDNEDQKKKTQQEDAVLLKQFQEHALAMRMKALPVAAGAAKHEKPVVVHVKK
jgi:hypothetical protein